MAKTFHFESNQDGQQFPEGNCNELQSSCFSGQKPTADESPVQMGLSGSWRYLLQDQVFRTVPLNVQAISASSNWYLMFHNKPEPGDLKALSALLRSKCSQ